MRTLLEANRRDPTKCHVYISEAQDLESADVVLAEELEKGQNVLVLKASDTDEVLHRVPEATQTAKHSMYSMEQWINSQNWH